MRYLVGALTMLASPRFWARSPRKPPARVQAAAQELLDALRERELISLAEITHATEGN